MENQLMSKPAAAPSRFSHELFAFPSPSSASSANFMTTWSEYMVDAFQRNVLFLDLLRQRGDEEIEITSRPMATVLRFDHEVLMSGRSLPSRSTTRSIASCRRQGSRSTRASGRSW